jgi:2-dehydropantoate 2-reductase
MRYIIYGAGAVGGTVGARLFEAGHDVVLICRGAHLDAIRQNGLLLRSPEGDARLPIPTAGHPREIEFTPHDVVILTMKSQHTEQALADLEAAAGDDVPVVCCQNGVDNERMAARRFRRVYGMVTMIPASHLNPGEVFAEGTPLSAVLHAGRFPGGTDAVIEETCAAISCSHMYAEADPHVMRLKYAKLLGNLGNAFQMLTDVSAWDGKGAAHDFMANVRDEAAACLRAAGIDWASEQEYRERAGKHVHTGRIPGHERSGSSTLQSLMRGHIALEVDYLNGEIVLLGALHGIPTPYNSVLRRAANDMARAGHKPGHYTQADLERMVTAHRVAVTLGD